MAIGSGVRAGSANGCGGERRGRWRDVGRGGIGVRLSVSRGRLAGVNSCGAGEGGSTVVEVAGSSRVGLEGGGVGSGRIGGGPGACAYVAKFALLENQVDGGTPCRCTIDMRDSPQSSDSRARVCIPSDADRRVVEWCKGAVACDDSKCEAISKGNSDALSCSGVVRE